MMKGFCRSFYKPSQSTKILIFTIDVKLFEILLLENNLARVHILVFKICSMLMEMITYLGMKLEQSRERWFENTSIAHFNLRDP